MLLARIELIGFKSFVQRTVIEIRDGITAIVGPNGCGKSNIIDAIRWVFGEKSPSSLRIVQQSELLFNGSTAHPAVNFAEVELIFNNEKKHIPIDSAEVSISRRLYRNGEGGYYLNGRSAPLKDIRALFRNMGIGFSPYSILGQGKTDRLLVAKPDLRREVFEEAAGIRGYRLKFVESNRKLAKVQQQVAQLKPMLGEIERQYQHCKTQRDKLSVYRKLSAQRNTLQMQHAVAEYQILTQEHQKRAAAHTHLQQQQQQLHTAEEEARAQNQQLYQQLEDIRSAIAHNREEGHAQQMTIERMKNSVHIRKERIVQIEGSIAEQSQLIQSALTHMESMRTRQEESRAQCSKIAEFVATLHQEQNSHTKERQQLTQKKSSCAHNITQCQRAIANHAKTQQHLQKKIAALSEVIVQELDIVFANNPDAVKGDIFQNTHLLQLDKKTTHLITRIVNIISDYRKMDHAQPAILSQIIDEIEHIAATLNSTYKEYMTHIDTQIEGTRPLFHILTDPKSSFVARHQLDQEYGRIQQEIETQRTEITRLSDEQAHTDAVLDKLSAHIMEINAQYERERMRLNNTQENQKQLAAQIEEQKSTRNKIHDRISNYRDQQENIKKEISTHTQSIKEQQQALQQYGKEEQSLNARARHIQKKIDQANAHIDKQKTRLQRIRTQLTRSTEIYHKSKTKVEIVATQFTDTFGKDITAQKHIADTDGTRSTEITRLKQEIRHLGNVNLMAEDEYADIQGRYKVMHEHYQDLIDAQKDLAEVTARINQESGASLKKTVESIATHFIEVCSHLFHECKGIIRLCTPETPLESDIDIIIYPQGKKNERVEHLSGGERAMASLALLFALYAHNPSRVVFLDEVDAALDNNNVVRIAHYIRDRLHSTQVVIVTHNRQSISIADTLVGITMEEYGVSKVIELAISDYV